MSANEVRTDRWEAALWLVALLLFAATRCLVPMDETDLFFNLRLGDLIRGTHQVPRANVLSFTHPEARDINLAWLFQVLLSWVFEHGGLAATVVLKTAFVEATLALLFAAAFRAGATPSLTALLLALGAWAAEPRFVERPHLVTFFGLGLLALSIACLEAGRAWRLRWLVPWGLLWANANSCFAFAPLLLVLYVMGAQRDGRGPALRARAWALRAAAIFAPLIVVNPSGLHTLRYLANHWRMPALRPLQEYRSVLWPVDAPFVFLVVVAGLVALAYASSRRRGGAPFDGWRFVLPCACLGLLASCRVRFVAEFALLVAPVTASAASRLPSLARLSQVARRSIAALAVLLALVPKLATHRRGEPWLDLDLEPGLVPFEAIAFLDAHDLRRRLYHDMEVGSYLSWDESAASLGRPALVGARPARAQARVIHPVFQDPRINGYPEAFHAVLRRDDLAPATWQSFLSQWDIDAALLTFPEANPRAAWFTPSSWALVFRSADALVFVRRDRARAAGLEDAEIPLTFIRRPDGQVDPLPLASPSTGVPRCLWFQRLGDFALERHDTASALTHYATSLESATTVAPGHPPCLEAPALAALRATAALLALERGEATRALALLGDEGEDEEAGTTRGLALSALGRWQDADQAFARVLGHTPGRADALFGSGVAREKLGDRVGAAARFRQLLDAAPTHAGAPHARHALGLPPLSR